MRRRYVGNWLEIGLLMLIDEVKLSNFGVASPANGISKEDQRSFALATRAQRGDYDDGKILIIIQSSWN